jgi:hypothetical protein
VASFIDFNPIFCVNKNEFFSVSIYNLYLHPCRRPFLGSYQVVSKQLKPVLKLLSRPAVDHAMLLAAEVKLTKKS